MPDIVLHYIFLYDVASLCYILYNVFVVFDDVLATQYMIYYFSLYALVFRLFLSFALWQEQGAYKHQSIRLYYNTK